MNKLEELMKEKKLIEEKIKALKNQKYTCGSVEVIKEHYPTGRPDEYKLRIRVAQCIPEIWKSRHVKTTICTANQKSDIIKVIPIIIKDLERMAKELEE